MPDEARDRAVIDLERRVVRYADLRPCHNAFIDSRTPGSESKENFTIVGPGVSENPEQHVHIPEPHGFNIGGARQPAGCVNSQHSHETAEVFVVHTGQWRFDFGEDAGDASVEVGPGDVVSLPTRAFRGFTNIGRKDDPPGFLWAVLGGDDPGRVTWAPRVFDLARNYGLVLLESGALVDTTRGEKVEAGARLMPVTSAEQVASMRRLTAADTIHLVARSSGAAAPGEHVVIGPGGPLAPVPDFTLERIDLPRGEALERTNSSAEVVFVHRGSAFVEVEGKGIGLAEGDTMSVPRGHRRISGTAAGTILFAVRGVT